MSAAMFNLPMQNLLSVDTDWDFEDPDLVGGPVQGSGPDAKMLIKLPTYIGFAENQLY
jgi:hypothetical protein